MRVFWWKYEKQLPKMSESLLQDYLSNEVMLVTKISFFCIIPLIADSMILV